jgi:RNA polymerase sigma-70 factor (ECF subfamily)
MMELYNICAMPVYNASLHIVNNEFDAEEIMQDSILKAFDNIDRFLGTEKDFISLVKKIAVNQSIDWYRKHSKIPFFTEIENEVIGQYDDDNDEPSFSIDLIKEKIDLLPDGYRMVLYLHLIDELDFVDIAEILDIKPSSVRSQYVRAKEKLKRELGA